MISAKKIETAIDERDWSDCKVEFFHALTECLAMKLALHVYPLVNCYITMENHHF